MSLPVTRQVAARDLEVDDVLRILGDRAPIKSIDKTTSPGVVYVWVDRLALLRPADLILNHGDPVRVFA